MKIIIAIVLGIVFGESRRPKVSITNYMPKDGEFNGTNDGLGICNGANTPWEAFSYTVALRYTSGSACCSGSIISLDPGMILTAAHCNGCTGPVAIGCDNPSNCGGSQVDHYPIQQFIQNPAYGQPPQFSNDIAIIRLTNPIETNAAREVDIPNFQPNLNVMRATGYGIDETGSIPQTVNTALMNEIENPLCDSIMSSALGGSGYIDASMICIMGGSVGEEGVPGTCSGDSGGPWTAQGDDQYGVTSWGLQGSGQGCGGCNCCTGYPGVGANVAYFSQWINGYLDAFKKGDFNYTSDFVPPV